MTDQTPTTEEIRRNYAFTRAGDRLHRTNEYFESFDHWLARRDAEVAAKALEQAAWDITRGAGLIAPPKREHPAVVWLRSRAAEIAESSGS